MQTTVLYIVVRIINVLREIFNLLKKRGTPTAARRRAAGRGRYTFADAEANFVYKSNKKKKEKKKKGEKVKN